MCQKPAGLDEPCEDWNEYHLCEPGLWCGSEGVCVKAPPPDELKDYARDVRRSRRLLAAYFEELLREGIKSGEFRDDLVVEDAALMLVGLMNGLGLLWIQDSRAFSLAERARSIVNTVLAGLEP